MRAPAACAMAPRFSPPAAGRQSQLCVLSLGPPVADQKRAATVVVARAGRRVLARAHVLPASIGFAGGRIKNTRDSDRGCACAGRR